MKQPFTQCASFVLAALMTTVAWAADSPIGNLKAGGEVAIDAPNASFTLRNQEYAYFSGDGIQTARDAQAAVTLNDGLKVTFVASSKGHVSRQDGVYNIELEQGHILVDAESGVDYRISSNGEPVSPDQALDANEGPFVVSVAEAGDVQFYMPAQLDDDAEAAGWLRGSLERAGVSAAKIAAIVAAITGAVIVVSDDDDPAS